LIIPQNSPPANSHRRNFRKKRGHRSTKTCKLGIL